MKHTEPSKLDIERFFAGEMDQKECLLLEEHFQECQACNSYLQKLRRERNEFLAVHPFSSLLGADVKTVKISWYNRIMEYLLKPALVPVYALLLVVAVAVPVFINRSLDNEIRFKGSVPLTFIYQRDGVIYNGDLTGKYRFNDLIQIRYNSSKEQFVALLSVDSKGTVSFYHPEQSSEFCSVKSIAGTDLTFPGSIMLDDSPGRELVIMLYSDEPLYTVMVSRHVSQLYTKYAELAKLKNVLLKEKLQGVSGVSTLLLEKE